MQSLFMQLVGRFHDIYGVISNSFKVADTVQHLGNCPVVLRGQAVLADPHQICVQLILVFVNAVFIFPDGFLNRFIVVEQNLNGLFHGLLRQFGHLYCNFTGNLNGNCRGCQQTFIQHGTLFFFGLFFLAVPYKKVCQFFQIFCEGEQQCSCYNVKDSVHQCNAHRIDCHGHNTELNQPVQQIEYRENNQGTDAVKADMHRCNTLCTPIYANAGKECSNTGTDVLSHNDRNSHAVGHLTRQGKRLQNTNRGSRTLNDSGKDSTHQNAHNRILERSQNVCELRRICQRADRIAHQRHTSHQN